MRAAVAIAIAGALFWLFAPAHVKDRVVGAATFATNERQCFEYYRKDFNDPDSAYLVGSRIWTRDDERQYNAAKPDRIFETYEAMLTVEARAKNKMGGYVQVSLGCPLVHGEFDDLAAGIYRLGRELE